MFILQHAHAQVSFLGYLFGGELHIALSTLQFLCLVLSNPEYTDL